MIQYESFVLENGLRVYVHQDKSVPTAVLNILYDVGSRDEDENKTGFAHLFEHLMFGGSANIPNFDTPLQTVGGDNNAFTSPDITNYYISLPAGNIETAFWLESDRMLNLAFSPENLEVQRKVVIEEFKQRYLNQPYGDLWLKLRPLAYKVHPYKWPTIGKEISHIEDATMDDVKAFFSKFYCPNNAILVVAGNVETEQIRKLSKKWFGPIPKGNIYKRDLPQEPAQSEPRQLEIVADVPVNAIYKVYHMCSRTSEDYFATDLLSDILGRGKASRFYEQLVKKDQLFSSISASISGSIDPGLFVISGKVSDGISVNDANNAIESIINDLRTKEIEALELQKVKNQAESTIVFSEMELLSRAMSLAMSVLLGDAELANKVGEKINKVTEKDIHRLANSVLNPNNCSTLFYKKG
ncbi:pitrilysin family protein [Flammeovirgaceae bacterium SG7u.111]|nr:pitrilysin family protein [Flammeovirgaceae bacterium SG7u.132]WPO34871.1 pitrilysin family protein [Flammeovirgaceae bacterium SG7u.111]